MLQINDGLYGMLEYKNNYWRGNTVIRMFGKDIDVVLSVDGYDNANFSGIQRESFRNFINNMNNIMNQVEQEIFKYYNENFEEYREMIEDDSKADKIVPKINSILDLENLVKPTELIVRRIRKDGKRRLGLLCDIAWDIEDGLGVKIENEVVEEIGYQDIVL